MSNIIDVAFYYPDPDTPHIAVVNTDSYSVIIGRLWNLAKKEDPVLVSCIGKVPCTFLIPQDLSLEPPDTLLSRSRDWLRLHRNDARRVDGLHRLGDIFPSVAPFDVALLLVVTEELLEGLDDLGDLNSLALKQRAKGIKLFRSLIPSPSTGISSFEGVIQVIDDLKDDFHSGRPAENFGPPVSLFNRALGLFDYHLRHVNDESFTLDLSPSLVELAHAFMAVSANSYLDESMRSLAIENILNRIFAVSMEWKVRQSLFGIKLDAINEGDIPFLVVELKNEAGLEGDASLEAALSYAHIATSSLDKSKSNYRTLSNYPAVLYSIMGDLLEIGVATYTDGLYYNILFSERLRLGFYAAENILRLSRAFVATRRVITDLRQFYADPPPAQGSIAHLFPSPLQVPTYTGSMPSLTFTRRLSRSGKTVVLAEDEITRQSAIYLATMARPRSADDDTVTSSSVDTLADTFEVVVKFTPQYHPEAHRLLANNKLAPVLHACVPVCGGMFMVVMDYVQGETAWQVGNKRGLLPYSVYKDIHDAVALLHSKDLVFCDLRTPNIMVVPGGSDSNARDCGMLVDFDWVGVHELGRYPPSLDDGLDDWDSSGVRRYGIMNKAHDLVMLTKFRNQCHSV